MCLLRDAPEHPGRVEVLWITRGRSLAVAPGALAFPGGAVDPVDRARRRDEPGPPARFAVMARAAARELAEETGHVVAAPTLRPLARWVTPEHEPRRFDTTFLVGVLPPAADPEPLPPGEVHEHGWARPDDLLDDVLAGRRVALPPTRAVLALLARATGGGPGGVPGGGPGGGPGPGP
ncbi:NUDIX domain-containing protein, partial [Aquipuribacter hungaricus]|uniref:NUDIX domain-containing protein n=1 Tax=Aquipuribacter hungaricus TaxID=545624 RepID=UPI0030EF54D2